MIVIISYPLWPWDKFKIENSIQNWTPSRSATVIILCLTVETVLEICRVKKSTNSLLFVSFFLVKKSMNRVSQANSGTCTKWKRQQLTMVRYRMLLLQKKRSNEKWDLCMKKLKRINNGAWISQKVNQKTKMKSR